MPDIYARILGEAVQLNNPAPKPDDLTCCVCKAKRRPHMMYRFGERRHRCPDCHAADRQPTGRSGSRASVDYFRRYYQAHREQYLEKSRRYWQSHREKAREKCRRYRERLKAAKAASGG